MRAKIFCTVSTHSRLKAAGRTPRPPNTASDCFNTQPPEGGWLLSLPAPPTMQCFNTQPPEGGWRANKSGRWATRCFNTQPPEGGWFSANYFRREDWIVSTHSRLKAAGAGLLKNRDMLLVSTHSRLKAAGNFIFISHPGGRVSTHSRLKAAGKEFPIFRFNHCGFNTQPPEGGWLLL